MAVLPAEIPTGLITGQYYFVNEDNIDVDTKPELTVVTGTVTFTSSVKTLRMPSKKAVLVPLAFDAVFDSQGNLTPFNGTGVGIELPATNSPLLTEQNYTWKVEFNLKEVETGFTVNLDSFDIQVPVGSTQDLSVLMPVDSSPGTITIQGGPQGEQGEQGETGPTPNIEVGTVVTGAPNVIVGPQGDKGVKGDPGGIVLGTNITTTDLNTVTTPGVYRTGSAPVAGLNYPILAIGVVTVYTATPSGGTLGYILQEFTPTHPVNGLGGVFYRRVSTGNTWNPWRTYSSTRTDQTAGRAIYQWDDLNNREQLIYGDTGVRNIKALANTDLVPARLYLSRNGVTVTLQIGSLTGTVAGGASVDILPDGVLPAGFRPTTFENYVAAGTPNNAKIIVHATGKLVLGSVPAGAINLDLTCQWRTNDPWPTTLPGTAIGTIPNL